MPINTELATKVWYRYQYVRDNGHTEYVKKAVKCDDFFIGNQWSQEDLAKLNAARRPALTINKIISTISNVMGEQIYNRAEISFRPRSGAPEGNAEILNKLFSHIAYRNQLTWKRSDMFTDGIIGSRGFLDVRMDFSQSLQGDIDIQLLNPKNVIVDPDADEYDPDTWNEVFTTKWLTIDDIALLYSKADAEILRNRAQSFFPYGYDSIDYYRDRFGTPHIPSYSSALGHFNDPVLRQVRVIERQHRMLDKQLHFVDPKTGMTRPVPDEWNAKRIQIVAQTFGLEIMPKLVKRIRWTVTADNLVLHDDWSPYKHFTVVPYFPYFRRGKTVGLVENLIGPQELLNKVSSQELHVINTTANSGYKVKAGALTNMSVEELEQRGAETGIVIEVNGDPDKDIVKIQPNAVPTGLDRVSYKAEEHIKAISNVPDSVQGQDRADVAAKAIQQKRAAAATNQAKPMDSLARTDHILARNVLDLIQSFYTEERVITILQDEATQATETITINQITPEGEVVNDLSLGEYDVIVTSIPARDTLEDSQFEQAVQLRQDLGVAIPDEILINASRLQNKREILQKMAAQAASPEAQQQAQLQIQQLTEEINKLRAEAANKQADAELKAAKAQKEAVLAAKEAATPPEADTKREEFELKREAHHEDLNFKREEHAMDMQHEQEKHAMTLQLEQQRAQQQAQEQAANAATQRAATIIQAKKGTAPQPKSGDKNG